MPLDIAKIETLCELANRSLRLYEPEISLYFVLHHDKKRKAAIDRQRKSIVRMRTGHKLLALLEEAADDNWASCPGLVLDKPGSFTALFKKRRYIAPVFLNLDQINTKSQGLHQVYHQIWHVLYYHSLYSKAKTEPVEMQDCIIEKGVLRFKSMKFRESKQNLKADTFAAIITQSERENKFIEDLTRMRSAMALEKIPGHLCEKYPFALAKEACQLIYDELKYTMKEKRHKIEFALNMAEEVVNTYGDETIQQWWDFCLPAQEMIWQDVPPDQVLGCAVFTSKEPFVRATAYMISETLDIPAKPPENKNLFNPFTDEENNRQLHQRLCEETFQNTLSKATMEQDVTPFYEAARTCNERLLRGDPSGWCAHGLARARRKFEVFLQGDAEIEDVTLSFQHANDEVLWTDLYKVAGYIIERRRHNKGLDLSLLAGSTGGNAVIEMIIEYLHGHASGDFSKAKARDERVYENTAQRVEIGFGPARHRHDSGKEKTAG